MPNRARRNQAVDARTYREAGAPRAAVEIHAIEIRRLRERRLDDWERQHRVPDAAIRGVTADALQDLLDNGQAGRDLVEVDHLLQPQAGGFAQHFDPDRGVNENHAASFRMAEDPRARPQDRLPRRRIPQSPGCDGPSIDARTRASPARPPASRSARRSPSASPPAMTRLTQDSCVSCV